jgi:hypothetical protein
MDDKNMILPPKLENILQAYFNAPEPDSDFASRLESDLRHHQIEMLFIKRNENRSGFLLQIRNSFIKQFRSRPLIAILAAILALVVLTGVAYAVGKLSGFIPGFGFTSDVGTVYVLDEPVEITKDAITIRLNNAVNDESKFWMELNFKGFPVGDDFSTVSVILPDGKKVNFETGNTSVLNSGDIRYSYSFPPLTGDFDHLVLLLDKSDGQSFSIPFKLRPLKEGEIIPAQTTDTTPIQSDTHNGLRLVIDNFASTNERTIFQVSLHFDHPNTWVMGPWEVLLTDDMDRIYPLTDITPDTMDIGNTRIYQTVPFNGTEQLTISLATFPQSGNLAMLEDFSSDAIGFTFDPGANPQVGQTWELDENILVGRFKLRVVRATMTAEPGFIFEFEPNEEVTGVMLYTPDPLIRGATGGVPVQNGNFTTGMTFTAFPQQPFEVRITRVYYTAQGTWQIHWQPSAASISQTEEATLTPPPTVVLDATPTEVSSDPIYLEVLALAQKFDAPFQKGPAWVHVVNEGISDPRPGQTYPLPYIRTELWYEVDNDGYITRYVWLDKNDKGQIIQQSVTVGNYSINFTTGDSGYGDGQRYRFSMDTLSHSLSQAEKYNTKVTREETVCEDGQPCILITLLDTFSQPAQNPDEPQAFYGSGRRAWINVETGQQVKTESFWRFEDSTERIDNTTRVLLVEKVAAPPQEILDIFAKVIVP